MEAELKLEQLRQQVAPRTITQSQQHELTAKISEFKGQRGTMIAAPSTPETEMMLVRWLGAPLLAAGRDIRILPGSPTATVLFPTGIIVSYPLPAVGPVILPRDESPAAAALVKALNEIGLNATAVPGMVKLAFLAAAIPIFLFVRSIFFRRTTRINEGLSEFKKQANLAVSIFLFLIVCVVVFAAGKLAWTWWSSL